MHILSDLPQVNRVWHNVINISQHAIRSGQISQKSDISPIIFEKEKMAITRTHEFLQACSSHKNAQNNPLHALELYPGLGSGQISV